VNEEVIKEVEPTPPIEEVPAKKEEIVSEKPLNDDLVSDESVKEETPNNQTEGNV